VLIFIFPDEVKSVSVFICCCETHVYLYLL